MMDNATIRAVEASIYAAGYPTDADAVLLVELDGPLAGIEGEAQTVEGLCKTAGARTVRVASDVAERARLWQGRKKAFGAMGRISPHLVVQDAVVPRTKLPAGLAEIHEIAQPPRGRGCNGFPAGARNPHPNHRYEPTEPDEAGRGAAALR